MTERDLIDDLIATYRSLNFLVRPHAEDQLRAPGGSGSVQHAVTRLRDRELRFSDALKARLTGIHMPEIFDETEAPVVGTEYEQVNLAASDQSKADLPKANLRHATLKETNLAEANLAGADLTAANLGGADLHDATLTDATLEQADLRHADLTGADMRGAKLTDAKLDGAKVAGARGVPPDLVRPPEPDQSAAG